MQIMTGIYVMDPETFRPEVEKRLGREVQLQEFMDKQWVIEVLQPLWAQEFWDMCQYTEDSGLVLPK